LAISFDELISSGDYEPLVDELGESELQVLFWLSEFCSLRSKEVSFNKADWHSGEETF
jgi:hypothetical protein